MAGEHREKSRAAESRERSSGDESGQEPRFKTQEGRRVAVPRWLMQSSSDQRLDKFSA